MARNKVQFQRGLSDVEFERLYGTEEKCREALFSWRWPEGFACPACGAFAHCELAKRALWQCNACRIQTSLTAGTIFAATKLDLTVWFRAMFHMTQTKQGISALELSRRLDVNYNTAWKMHHKLRQVMLERNQGKPLDGLWRDNLEENGAAIRMRSGGRNKYMIPPSPSERKPFLLAPACGCRPATVEALDYQGLGPCGELQH